MVDIGQTLVAFANADGGELLIGVEDDGTVSGARYPSDQLQLMLNADRTHVHQDTPLPATRKAIVNVDGSQLVYFYVPKGTDHIYLTADGRCLRRADRDSLPVGVERITFARSEEQSRRWDRLIADGAKVTDLDLDLVAAVASQLAYGISVEKCLQYLDLAEFTPGGIRLRNAAVVLFSKDIRHWHPYSQVRILTVRGTELFSGPDYNVIRDESVTDNVLRLVDSAWERLQLALAQQPAFTEKARFEQRLLYPQIACREALINAIVHRDYSTLGRGIEITMYQDRMEIVSPGRLLSTVSLADLTSLKGVHESRNPLIARVLRESGLVREMGEGLKRIYEVMRSSAMAEPTLSDGRGTFTVALHNRSRYEPAVDLWLSNFDSYRLTEPQRAVMALGYGGRRFSAQEAMDALGTIDWDQLREIISPLRRLGLIERTPEGAQREARRLGIPRRKIPSYRAVPDLASVRTGKEGVHEPSRRGAAAADAGERPTVQVLISNLPLDADETVVVDFLEAVAPVIELQMRPGIGHANSGYCSARLEWERSQEELLQRLDGRVLNGRRVRVMPVLDLRG